MLFSMHAWVHMQWLTLVSMPAAMPIQGTLAARIRHPGALAGFPPPISGARGPRDIRATAQGAPHCLTRLKV